MTETIHPQDQAQAHAITQQREANDAGISEVNAAYDQYLTFGKQTEEAYLAWANGARRIGIQLITLKASLRKRFSGLFTVDSHGRKMITPTLSFTQNTGCRFMRLAAKNPNPFATFAEATKAMREMNETSTRGQQQSRGTLHWLSQFQRGGMNLLAMVVKEEEKQELTSWPRPQLEALASQLQPFAEKHQAALKALEVAA